PWGFYGDDIDVAFRLLEAPTVKRVLRDAPEAPLVLVVSEEIWAGIVRHGYLDDGPYQQRVQVKVGGRRRRGRVHLPVPARADLLGAGAAGDVLDGAADAAGQVELRGDLGAGLADLLLVRAPALRGDHAGHPDHAAEQPGQFLQRGEAVRAAHAAAAAHHDP